MLAACATAASSEAATRRWSGLGDGTSWNAPANWEGVVVPGASDDALLDHSLVSGAYSVLLPGAAVTVSVRKLSLLPQGGAAITLTLPASNTANPGLKVGDGAAGTDDIVIGAGAVLRNASTATFGNGIEANSVSNGTVRIEDGGRYVHATLRSAAGMAPLLSTAPGTRLGVFEYDAPGTSTVNISASGRTYGSLTLTRASGGVYGALGSSDLRVRGHVTINPGASLSSTMTGALRLEGNLTNNGGILALATAQPVFFQATGVQTVSGSADLAIGGTGRVEPSATLAMASRLFVNGTLTIDGTLRLDTDMAPRGSGTFVYHPATGALVLNATQAISLNTVQERYWPASSGPTVVSVTGAGGLSIELNRTVSQRFTCGGPVIQGQHLTLSGLVERFAGGSFSGSPVYSGGATLRYADGLGVGAEWIAGQTEGAGVPRNVVVDAGAEVVTLPASYRHVPGDLTITSGTLAYSPTSGGLTLLGSLTVNGALGTLGRPVSFAGSGIQTLSGTAPVVIPTLRLAKPSGSLVLATDVSLGAPAATALQFDGGAGDVLELGGHVLSLQGSVAGANPSGAIRGDAQASLEVGGAGLAGPLMLASGGALLRRLVVAASGGVGLTLGTNLALSESLELDGGVVVTAGHTLSLGPGATVSRVAGWVFGLLAKAVPAGPSVSRTFEVGDLSVYAPVTIQLSGVVSSTALAASTAPGDHSELYPDSGFDESKTVNRTWTLEGQGLSFDAYSATVEYPAGEVDPGADPAAFALAVFDGSSWVTGGPGSALPTSTQGVGLDRLGDLVAGELPMFEIETSSVGNGNVVRLPDQPEYFHGQIVRLDAQPDFGYHLDHWQGDASGSANPLELRVTLSRVIAGVFAVNEYALNVAVVGVGSVSRDPDQPTYLHGSVVTLTATPALHWHFAGWSGGASGLATTTQVTMLAPTSVTATFQLDRFPVDVTIVGQGSVTRDPEIPTYPYGSTVTLAAVPATGRHFDSWSGDASGSTNPFHLLVDGPKAVTATFAINSYQLFTPVTGNGTVSRDPDLTYYPHGTQVTLTAHPAPDHHLVSWSGDASGNANPLVVTMDSEKTVLASFAIDTHVLTVTVVGGGSVSRDPNLPAYDHGSTVTLTATPDPGQAFAGWTGDVTSYTNPLAVVMNTDHALTVTFEPNTPKAWTGLGDGVSWADGLNWVRGTPPALEDEVVLDNSHVLGTYGVTLPGGASAVAIQRLTIQPSAPNTITLTLPAPNAANPGLAVGDGVAMTDDIVLGAGGVLVNRSGASLGNGIQTSTANGLVRIENGGRYLHATLRSVNGVAPHLSTALGTGSGVFEYDVPGTSTYNISASGRTYGELVLTRSAGKAGYGALGSSPCRIRGTLRINTGVTFGSTMTGALQLEGNLVIDGASLALPASQPVFFQGTTVQSVTGAGGLALGGASTITDGSTVSLTASPFSNAGTFTVEGTLELTDGAAPTGAGSYHYDPVSGTLRFADASDPRVVGSVPYWPVTDAPARVEVVGAAGISIATSRTVATTLSVGGPVEDAEQLTISGTLEFVNGGSLSGSPTYASASRLRYLVPRSVGDEWGAGTALGPGVPSDVEVAAGGVVQLPSQDRTAAGDLTVTSGTLALSGSGGDLGLDGDLSVTGSLQTNGRALELRGTGTQTLTSAAPLALDHLRLGKPSGEVQMLTDLSLTGVSGNVLAFEGSGGDVLVLGGHTLTLAGSIGGSNTAGALRAGPGSRLVLTGSDEVGTLRMDGSASLQDLVVDLAGVDPFVEMRTAVSVAGTLSLTRGAVLTRGYVLAVEPGGAVVRGTGFVGGLLRKTVGAGSGTSLAFEVGSGSSYAPASVVFDQVTTPGTLTVWATSGDHPEIASASLDASHSVNRYWTLSAGGISFDHYSATFEYPTADVDPASNPLDFESRRFSGGAWSPTSIGTRTLNSTQVTGVTGFGDFAVATPQAYSITLTSTGSGTATKSPDLPLYDNGSQVTLTATPAPGYHFTGWSGDASGTTNPLVVTVTSNLSIQAGFALNGPKRWLGATGGGDGSTWTNPLNWSDGAVPIASEEVILDNSAVSGSYQPTLPAGATTTTLLRLTITPTSGNAITLVLPATNTANPGLLVGDGAPGTDDVLLLPGGVLRNASGASAGSGVALSSSANGTLRIDAGGRYVHATLRSPSAVVALLSTSAGTETGEFEYDVPGTASFALDVSGRTYGSLTLTRTAGTATYTAAGSSALNVRGHLKTNNGVTLGSTMTGALNLAGNLTVKGQDLSFPSGQAVNFNGSGVQTVSGSANVSIGGASSVASAATLAVAAANFNNNGTMTINGTLQVEEGGFPGGNNGNYNYNAVTGRLLFNNTTLWNVNNDRYWPTTNGPVNITVQGAGGVSMNVTRTVTGLFQLGAGLTKANSLTVTGTLQMNPGGVMIAQSPKYSGNGSLTYYVATAAVGLEWVAGTSVGTGVPRDVTVQAGTVSLPNTDRNVVGTLSIAPGATLACNASAGNLLLRGNAVLNGTLQTNGRTVQCTGTATQTLGGSGTPAIDFLTLDKNGGLVQLLTDLSVTGTGASCLTFIGASGDILDLNGRQLSLAGGLGGTNANARISGSPTSVLALSGGGALGTLRLATGAQTLNHLLMTGASPTLTLGTPLTLSGTLGLGDARLTTGSNLLVIAAGGTVTRGSGFVIGSLRKSIATGAGVTAAFEVGTGSVYAPASLVFGNVTTGGTITATTVAGDHPQIASSGLNPAKTVNRYWTLTASGLSFNQYAATFQFAPSDLDAGTNPNTFQVNRYSGSWTPAFTGARTATSTEATGLTAFGDFAIGAVAQYTLNITTVGNGGVTKNPDVPEYDAGTVVALTATPLAGHSFVGWSGDTSTTTNPLTLTMTRNHSLTASFTVALNVTVSGNGSVTKSPDQPNYAPGSNVTLTAVPAAGHHFVGWSGSATGSTNPLVVTMDGNKDVTATFAINTYALTLSSTGHGSASQSPNLATYPHGTTVTLTGTPQPGHAFVAWGGDTSSSVNPLTVVMTRDRTIVGRFTFALSVTSSSGGSVSVSPNQTAFTPGSVATLTAQPDAGWHFVGWSGSASGSTNPLALTMDSDKSVTATFAINQYTLGLSVTGSGTVTPSPNQPTYAHGTPVTLTATPAVGWHFVGWSGDASGSTNPQSLTMDANKSVTATFEINQYVLDTSTTGSGYLYIDPGLETYPHGTTVTVLAVPAVGWHFVSWGGDASGSTNPLSLTMDANKSVTAKFAINQYTLSLAVAGSGTVTPSPNQPTYAHGTVVTLTAQPTPGNEFIGWGGDTTETTNPLTVTMTRDRTITGTFTATLSVSISGSGTVARDPNEPRYLLGTLVTLTATPDPLHHFVGWSGDASGSANPLGITLDGDKIVTATFAIDAYSVDVAVVGKGSVTRTPDAPAYDHGSSVQLEAVPATGWLFTGWSGDASGEANPIQLDVEGPLSVTASFVDVTPPSVAVLEPNGGERLVPGTTATLLWSASDLDGIRDVDLVLVRTDAEDSLTVIASNVPNLGSYDWTVQPLPSEGAYLRVVARDSSGNETMDQSDGALAIDSPPLESELAVPADLRLLPISPNPARSRARLRFTLPSAQRIRLSVVDIQGREVALLADGPRPAGVHDVTWEGRASGTPLPAGLYLVRLDAGRERRVQRFVVTP